MQTKKNKDKSSLNIHLLELVRLRIAQINDCSYCIGMHRRELKCMGDTDSRLSLVSTWKEVRYFSKKEKALLALTDDLTGQKGNKPSDKVCNVLLPHFSKEEISRLILAINQMHNWMPVMKRLKG